ncbi:MAG: Na+/H+ antiporter subunit E [Candidatus Puniceispirillales bacterium WSBS_2018_MAG_OTU23]
MMRGGVLFFILMMLWLLMSGHYTALIIGFGVISTAFATWMSARMGGTDNEGLPLHLLPRLPMYFLWLFKEIITSNIATAMVILRGNASPELFHVKIGQKTEAGVALHANSITLTPGTVTVNIDDDRFLVHAITKSFGKDVRSGEMDRRVTALEGQV